MGTVTTGWTNTLWPKYNDLYQEQIYTVYGYIHRETGAIYEDIIDTIIMFYVYNYHGAFHRNKCVKELDFIGKNKIQKNDPLYVPRGWLDIPKRGEIIIPKYSTALFGDVVTNDMCQRFEVDFKFYTDNDIMLRYLPFFVGFGTSKDCIVNYNEAIGVNDNREHSTGLLFVNSRRVHLFDVDNEYKQLPQEMTRSPLNGTNFTMSFDFDKDCFSISHKYIPLYCNPISLKQTKSIVVGASVSQHGDAIEIIQWRFY